MRLEARPNSGCPGRLTRRFLGNTSRLGVTSGHPRIGVAHLKWIANGAGVGCGSLLDVPFRTLIALLGAARSSLLRRPIFPLT